MKLDIYVVAPEPISTTYFVNPSHQSVCLYVYSSIVAGQRLGKTVTAATNIHNNRRIVGRVGFNTVRVVSKESRRLVLPGISCFLTQNKFVYIHQIQICSIPCYKLSCSYAYVLHPSSGLKSKPSKCEEGRVKKENDPMAWLILQPSK
jgi:hypothetical protein